MKKSNKNTSFVSQIVDEIRAENGLLYLTARKRNDILYRTLKKVKKQIGQTRGKTRIETKQQLRKT